MNERDKLKESFLSISLPKELRDFLGLTPKQFSYYFRKESPAHYHVFTIPKKVGGVREIASPCAGLKMIQKKLNEAFMAVYDPKPSAHAFVLGRSIVSNAERHQRRRYILKVDLENFFPTIHFGRVRGMFASFPFHFNSRIATMLARVCCHQNRLPQGAPTSPVISNIICAKMDTQMQGLAKQNKCRYTRYADDIVLSTSLTKFPKGVAQFTPEELREVTLSPELIEIVEINGFSVNHNKVRILTKSQRQSITGVVTNQKLNVRREFVRQIRAMLHSWDKYGLEAAEKEMQEKYYSKSRAPYRNPPGLKQVIRGKIEFVGMVRGKDDPVYQKLKEKHHNLIHGYGLFPVLEDALWIIEGSERDNVDRMIQGTGFMLEGYGLITCCHIVQGRSTLIAYSLREPNKHFPVSVLKSDSELDLAILQLGAHIRYRLRVGNSEKVNLGDEIMLVGFPNYSVGQSVYKSKGAVAAQRSYNDCPHFLLNIPIVTGNSGGPVLDAFSRVIGVASHGVGSTNMFGETDDHRVIPINALRRVSLTDMETGEKHESGG